MGRLEVRRCIQRFSSRSRSLRLLIEFERWCINDNTDMLMPTNKEGFSFGHLLKCLATVFVFMS